jgi:hypothetical protein
MIRISGFLMALLVFNVAMNQATVAHSSSILDGSLFEPRLLVAKTESKDDLRQLSEALLAAKSGSQTFPYQTIAEWILDDRLTFPGIEQNLLKNAAYKATQRSNELLPEGPMAFADSAQILPPDDYDITTHSFPSMQVQLGAAIWLNKCQAFVNPLIGNQLSAAELVGDVVVEKELLDQVTGEMTPSKEQGLKLRTVVKNMVKNTMKRNPNQGAPIGLFTAWNRQSDFFQKPDNLLLLDGTEIWTDSVDANSTLLTTQKMREVPFGGANIRSADTGTMFVFGIIKGPKPLKPENYSFAFRGAAVDSYVSAGGEFSVVLPCVSLEMAKAARLEIMTNINNSEVLVSLLSTADKAFFSDGFFGARDNQNETPVYEVNLGLDPRTWFGHSFKKRGE